MTKDFASTVHKISRCKFQHADRTYEQEKKITKYATAKICYATDASRIDRSAG